MADRALGASERFVKSRGSKRSWRSKKSKRTMTFREMREQQRIADKANLGPGCIDGHLKAFGEGMRGIDFGSKYVFRPD